VGRFATTVEFYSRYREPYSPRFFQQVAEQLNFGGSESLLDAGCGPGLLAIGFAPYVGGCIGLDPEPGMLEAAAKAVAKSGVVVSLIAGRLENFASRNKFNVITIGRALHWLDREAALPRLNALLADDGVILICGATSVEGMKSPWVLAYNHLRKEYASESEQSRYRLNPLSWFDGSTFAHLQDILVTESRSVTIDDLIGRSLSRSNTSLEVLGTRRAEFEDKVRATLEPYTQNGELQEEVVARASVFERRR
jgi:SAM-dependent methyltransferase